MRFYKARHSTATPDFKNLAKQQILPDFQCGIDFRMHKTGYDGIIHLSS